MSQKRPSRRERRAAQKSGRSPTSHPSGFERKVSRVPTALAGTALVALVIAVFFPARQFQFISLDDPQYVSANARVLSGISVSGLKWALTTTSFYWHPLTWLSHMLDVELFGVHAGAHHLVNVIIHALSTLLLFLALRMMTGATGKSAFIAALFGMHPLHVESVAWVAERKDVLSTFFWMLGLVIYAKYVSLPSVRKKVALSAVFGLGLLAKPMIVTFPFVLLLLDVWPLSRIRLDKSSLNEWSARVIEKMPLFVLSAVSIVATLISQRDTTAVVSLKTLPWSARIGNGLVSYVVYLHDTVWPSSLAPFYPLQVPSAWTIAIAAVLLILITAGAARAARSLPFVLIGWLWYLGTLVPVIGLVQAGDQARADRFTYVPIVGIFIAVTWLVSAFAERSREARVALVGVSLAIVAGLSIVARKQLEYWRDDLSLWGRTVAVTSGNYRAENLYGVALTSSGRLDEGVKHYEAALRIWPDDPGAHNNLGTARMDQGRYNDAVEEFITASRLRPGDSNYRYNLAVALDAAGRRAEAQQQVSIGLKLDPGNADLIRARGVLGEAK